MNRIKRVDPFKIDEEANKINEILKKIDKIDGDISFEFNILPYVICFIGFIINIVYLIKIEVNSNGKNWETNKCSSKYVFFSGFLNSQDNEPLTQSVINFTQCIKRFM